MFDFLPTRVDEIPFHVQIDGDVVTDAGGDVLAAAGARDQEGVIVYAPAGLASITLPKVVNGAATYHAFTSGTTGPVLVTATKNTQGVLTSGYLQGNRRPGAVHLLRVLHSNQQLTEQGLSADANQ